MFRWNRIVGIMGLSASGVAGESVDWNEVRRRVIGVTITEAELFGRAIESTPLPLGKESATIEIVSEAQVTNTRCAPNSDIELRTSLPSSGYNKS